MTTFETGNLVTLEADTWLGFPAQRAIVVKPNGAGLYEVKVIPADRHADVNDSDGFASVDEEAMKGGW